MSFQTYADMTKEFSLFCEFAFELDFEALLSEESDCQIVVLVVTSSPSLLIC